MGGRKGRRVVGVVLAVVLAAATVDALVNGSSTRDGAFDAARYPDARISIMAPADPGGGWDETARALQQTIREDDLAPGVDVFNVGGAGGTLGLARFVSRSEGDPYELMVTGLVMLGAVETNDSPFTLDDVTPVAGITSEAEAIVVGARSPFKTVDDVMAALKQDPGGVSWGGGSAGGSDQLLVGQLAKSAGVDPADTRYVAHSGGGEAVAAILSGSVDVGVSGVAEFDAQVKAGKMRALAVSSPGSLPVGGKPVRSLKQQDIDVELLNWRAIVAPPGISTAQRTAVTAFVERVRRTPEWRANLKRFGWTDFKPTGAAFSRLLDAEQDRVDRLVDELGLGS